MVLCCQYQWFWYFTFLFLTVDYLCFFFLVVIPLFFPFMFRWLYYSFLPRSHPLFSSLFCYADFITHFFLVVIPSFLPFLFRWLYYTVLPRSHPLLFSFLELVDFIFFLLNPSHPPSFSHVYLVDFICIYLRYSHPLLFSFLELVDFIDFFLNPSHPPSFSHVYLGWLYFDYSHTKSTLLFFYPFLHWLFIQLSSHGHFLLFSKRKEYFVSISPLTSQVHLQLLANDIPFPCVPLFSLGIWEFPNPRKAPCMEVKTYPYKVLLRNVLSHFITANFYWTIFFSLRALRFFFSWYILSSASLMYSSILIESSSAMT